MRKFDGVFVKHVLRDPVHTKKYTFKYNLKQLYSIFFKQYMMNVKGLTNSDEPTEKEQPNLQLLFPL